MAKQKKHTKTRHKKRQGAHHKKTKAYHSTYWPYIPILLLIAGLFLLALSKSPTGPNVLAFATEISSQALLSETNQRRADSDAEPLSLNDRLTEAARAKAQDMAERNYWSHETPDGQQPWIFIDGAEYQYIKAGENLAYGFLTSEQTVNGWMNSQTHRENMLDPAFSEVGFGYVNAVNFQGSNEETIVVAMYAQPMTADSSEPSEEQIEDNQAETVFSMNVPTATSPDVKSINRLESIIGNQFGWMTFSLGIVSGTAITGLFVSHGIRLRRLLKRGESFILHHPLLDVCLVSLLLLTAFLANNVGYIL